MMVTCVVQVRKNGAIGITYKQTFTYEVEPTDPVGLRRDKLLKHVTDLGYEYHGHVLPLY
jgi:hypothetical protein